jgi:hypothetical protein
MPSRVKSKISSTVQRISSKDIASQEARELFLSSLPDFLFSTVGGNTACVEVVTRERCRFIFDAGTGIRELGKEILADIGITYKACPSSLRPSIHDAAFPSIARYRNSSPYSRAR